MAVNATSARFAGPRDRDSFFDAQRRNRRATWRLSATSVLAAIVMGIPVALAITPLLYAAVLLLAEILSPWISLPPAFWRDAGVLAHDGLLAFAWLTQPVKIDNPQPIIIGGAVLLLPGVTLTLALWVGLNALFQRAGVGGALLALKAREPSPADLRELQLCDVIEEMAIASGLPAPKVMLIDGPGANAAAIGTSPRDARLIVSRSLIERLTRDELEGALAHLIASIGNGDLRIAFRVTSVFETYGLLLAFINAPFGSESRRTLWRIVRFAVAGRGTSDTNAAEAAAVAQLLSRDTQLETDDIDRLFDSTRKKKSVFRSIRDFLLFPIFLTNFAVKLSLWFFSFTMLLPSMALLWRKRKYLADACAVQLTRNPDGLAEALRKLNADRHPIPGGAWASHLFLVSPAGADRVSDSRADAEQKQTVARIWAASAAGSAAGPPLTPASRSATNADFMNEILTTGRAAVAGDQAAVARMMAFRQAAAAALGKSVDELPDLSDLAAAQRGDPAAIRRLGQLGDHGENDLPLGENSDASSASPWTSAGFFPSLKRRLKRLDGMGAHVQFESEPFKPAGAVFIGLLSLFLAPFALLALALLLLLIAILIMSSLAFMAIWMAFIHQIFILLPHH